MDYFILDGIDSRTFGIYLHNQGTMGTSYELAAQMETVTEKVAGQDGEIFFEQVYRIKEFDLSFFIIDASNENLQKAIRFLSQKGLRELVLSYEIYKYYNVYMEQQIKLDNLVSGGFAKIRFKSTSPYGLSRFTTPELVAGSYLYDRDFAYDSGLVYYEDMTGYSFGNVSTTPNISVYHGGNCDRALPIVTLVGSATSFTMSLYSDAARTKLVSSCSYGAFSGTLVLDSQKKLVYLNGSVQNNTFTGKFIELLGRFGNTFSEDGEVSSMPVINQLTLTGDFSATNDFYNGKKLAIISNNLDYRKAVYTITDYVGATKTVTLDRNLEFATAGDPVTIYDASEGQNYISFTGGSLNFSPSFNFRYTYI